MGRSGLGGPLGGQTTDGVGAQGSPPSAADRTVTVVYATLARPVVPRGPSRNGDTGMFTRPAALTRIPCECDGDRAHVRPLPTPRGSRTSAK